MDSAASLIALLLYSAFAVTPAWDTTRATGLISVEPLRSEGRKQASSSCEVSSSRVAANISRAAAG